MRQVIEFSWNSLTKAGEELCGDSVVIRTGRDFFVAVLSDGLGSGVKANILSTLTAEIAARMFESGGSVEEVMQTLVDTLPECSVRKLAYATFAVLMVYNGRDAHLVEFDSPPMILIRENKLTSLPLEKREVKGRVIREAHFEIEENDFMVLISDGYEHAGLGGIFRLGWGWKSIAQAVQRFVQAGVDAVQLTQALSRTCMKFDDDKPGDDSTVISMRVRPAVSVCILTGPPNNKELDAFAVSRLMNAEG
ncbi:MAG: Stage II sporulation protein E (SpoIIE) [Syntrophaceae bacterium PtaU1.Bin231]|nr:MAG: Stage II sporulation protein E (SpoIIE) [Syntrophaceae bacterium PtaU1.Bin231]